jgi:hypothetical protein
LRHCGGSREEEKALAPWRNLSVLVDWSKPGLCTGCHVRTMLLCFVMLRESGVWTGRSQVVWWLSVWRYGAFVLQLR